LEDSLEKLLELLHVENEEDGIKVVQALAQRPVGVTVLVDGLGGIQVSSIGNLPPDVAQQILLEGIRVISNAQAKGAAKEKESRT
jgi:dihydroxyacetone kinase